MSSASASLLPFAYKAHQPFAIRVDHLSNIAFTGFSHLGRYRQCLAHYKRGRRVGQGNILWGGKFF
jgi:hypothetical protein